VYSGKSSAYSACVGVDWHNPGYSGRRTKPLQLQQTLLSSATVVIVKIGTELTVDACVVVERTAFGSGVKLTIAA